MEKEEKMRKHTKKMIAPIVVTILLVLYYAGFAVAAFYYKFPLSVCVPATLLPLIFGGVMIGVCVERIREIQAGEEDDLSKY